MAFTISDRNRVDGADRFDQVKRVGAEHLPNYWFHPIMRHPLHSICPYFAMFPEDFVLKQLLAYTERGDTVFDPFCGEGTTVFESLLNDRNASGVDINPVAACIAGAKADTPTLWSVNTRLDRLKENLSRSMKSQFQRAISFVRAFTRLHYSKFYFCATNWIGKTRASIGLSPQLSWAPCMESHTRHRIA